MTQTSYLIWLALKLSRYSKQRLYHEVPELKRLPEKYCARRDENHEHLVRKTSRSSARMFNDIIVKPRKYTPPKPKPAKTGGSESLVTQTQADAPDKTDEQSGARHTTNTS